LLLLLKVINMKKLVSISFVLAFAFAFTAYAQMGASYPPVLVQATNVLTDASGNWSVTWNTSFQSNTPFTIARAVVTSTNNPISCEVMTRANNGASGWCRQSSPIVLDTTIIAAGLTLNPFTNLPATNTAVMVIGRDTTQ
jgi:hypothetical protein